MISRVVSTDIVRYLQEEKKLSVAEIAAAMDTTVDHIEKVVKKKEPFTAEDFTAYLESSKLHFWEFAIEAIPLNHLPEKARRRVLLCKEISIHLKKKKNKK
jgi:hypothetical protein